MSTNRSLISELDTRRSYGNSTGQLEMKSPFVLPRSQRRYAVDRRRRDVAPAFRIYSEQTANLLVVEAFCSRGRFHVCISPGMGSRLSLPLPKFTLDDESAKRFSSFFLTNFSFFSLAFINSIIFGLYPI